MKLRKTKKGFTIVELVIVIGVIGILAGILIPTFVNVTQKADEAALKSNLANAYSAYVADAADGVVDKENAASVIGTGYIEAKTYTIELLKQDNVVLVGSDAKQYKFAGDAWKNVADLSETPITDFTDHTIASYDNAGTQTYVAVTYNGYKVYSWAARN